MRWFVLFLLLANVALFFWLQQQSSVPPSASPSPDIGTLRLRTELHPAAPAVAIGVPDSPSTPEAGGVPERDDSPEGTASAAYPSMAEPLATTDSIPGRSVAAAVNAGVGSTPFDDRVGSTGESTGQGSASPVGRSESVALNHAGADRTPAEPVPAPVGPLPEDRSGGRESSTEPDLGSVAPTARGLADPDGSPAEQAMPSGPTRPEEAVDIADGMSAVPPGQQSGFGVQSTEQTSRPAGPESFGHHDALPEQAGPSGARPSEGPAVTGRSTGQTPPEPDPGVAADQIGPVGSSAGHSTSAPRLPVPDGSGGAQAEGMIGASGAESQSVGDAIEPAASGADAFSGETIPGEPAPASAPTPVCFRAGPFAPQEAEDLAREMPPEVDVLSDSPEEYPEVTGYYVLIPPLASRTEGIRKLDQLRAAGIKDVWLFRSGELNNAISLGLFSREPTARRHARSVGEKGFATEVKARTSVRTRHWLVLQADQEPDLHRAIALPDGAALEPQPCP